MLILMLSALISLDGKQIWYNSSMRQKVKNDIDVAKGSGDIHRICSRFRIRA